MWHGATVYSWAVQSPACMQRIKGRLVCMMQIMTSTAAAYGCSTEVDWMEEAHPYYPPTVNDPALAAFVKDVGAR